MACDLGYQFLADHHDRVPDIAAELRHFDNCYRSVLDALAIRWTESLVAELAAASVNEVNFEPYPTTAWLLDELAARRIPMAVITDAWPSVRNKYAQLGFVDYCASFVVSAEAGCTKPDVGLFRPALDALEVDPGEVLFIDDGPEIASWMSPMTTSVVPPNARSVQVLVLQDRTTWTWCSSSRRSLRTRQTRLRGTLVERIPCAMSPSG